MQNKKNKTQEAMPRKKKESKTISDFLDGKINDAFAVLGLHENEDGIFLRAYLPEAIDAAVTPVAGDKPVKVIDCQTEKGFHIWELKERPSERYRFQISPKDGAMKVIDDPYSFPILMSKKAGKAWAEGKMYDAQNWMGANLAVHDGVEGIIFRVWAPNARRVSVCADFNDWNERRHIMRFLHDFGIWELFIPGNLKLARYKFCIVPANGGEAIYKSDPYSRQAEHPPETASVVCVDREIEWSDDDWMKARKKARHVSEPISIYEVHPASWRKKDGRMMSYFEMETELVGYVAEMGFTHVELMPVTEYPFDGSWGYQTLGMFAPTIRFGTISELKYLINAFHRANIGVLMDWVPAHFPADSHGLANFEGAPLYEYADTRKGFHPDWKTHIYNYKRHEVLNFLLSSALYWLEEFHIDGIRVDAVSSMLYHSYSRQPGEWEPNEYGGPENIEALNFIRRLNDLVKERAPGALMIAEESTTWQGVTKPTKEYGLGFDFKWNMGWMNDTLKYVKRDFYARPGSHHEITHCIDYAFTENFVLPLSHDEVVHCKSSMLAKFPGFDADKFAGLRAYYAYMWAHPGKKLLFMGNELAQWGEWDFQGELNWDMLQYPPHKGVQSIIRELNRLYCSEPGLHRNDLADGFAWIKKNDANESVYAFSRSVGNGGDGNEIVVAVNFSPMDFASFRLGVHQPGGYKVLLHSSWQKFGGDAAENGGAIQSDNTSHDGCFHSLKFSLPRLSTIILKKEP